jgi:hypothetical protein
VQPESEAGVLCVHPTPAYGTDEYVGGMKSDPKDRQNVHEDPCHQDGECEAPAGRTIVEAYCGERVATNVETKRARGKVSC